MIRGINPLVISKIEAFSFKRYGRHPYFYSLAQKKHPILFALGYFGEDEWGFAHPAYVNIYGSDSNVIKKISCKSNSGAVKLRDELRAELESFLKKFKVE